MATISELQIPCGFDLCEEGPDIKRVDSEESMQSPYNQKIEQQIIDSKHEVETLSKQLQQSLKSRRNKLQYNQLAESLKTNYQPLNVQKNKLDEITKEIQQLENKYLKEHLDYQKKQKCLRLALSALKSVLEDQTSDNGQTPTLNHDLYVVPNSTLVSVEKISQNISSQMIQFSEENNSGREEGEQVEGGQILY